MVSVKQLSSLDASKVASVEAVVAEEAEGGCSLWNMPLKTASGHSRSYSTTPASCKEIKPRNANEVWHSIFVFEFGIPM